MEEFSTLSELRDTVELIKQKDATAAIRLLDIRDVGTVTAGSIISFFSDPVNIRIWDNLMAEVKPVPYTRSIRNTPITGKTIVFTGTLENMSREGAKLRAVKMGAKVSNSISPKTDILVVGTGGGAKKKTAEKLGVKTITEEEWDVLIN
jgi:DNA ligase (NAD+)